MQIMESLGGDQAWFDRFLAEHAAVFYYWMCIGFYLASPKNAYNFMQRVEHHAADTYSECRTHTHTHTAGHTHTHCRTYTHTHCRTHTQTQRAVQHPAVRMCVACSVCPCSIRMQPVSAACEVHCLSCYFSESAE